MRAVSTDVTQLLARKTSSPCHQFCLSAFDGRIIFSATPIFLSTFSSAFGLLVGPASASTTSTTVTNKAPFSLSSSQVLSHIVVCLHVDRLGLIELYLRNEACHRPTRNRSTLPLPLQVFLHLQFHLHLLQLVEKCFVLGPHQEEQPLLTKFKALTTSSYDRGTCVFNAIICCSESLSPL